MKKVVHSKCAPAAIGPYSQAIKSNGFLFVSGQIPINPDSGEIVEGGVDVQTRQSLENLKAILNDAGIGFENYTSLYPNGGYSASNPTIRVLSSTPACTLTPVTIIPIVIAAAITTATVLFFMVILLFSVISLSHGHSTT